MGLQVRVQGSWVVGKHLCAQEAPELHLGTRTPSLNGTNSSALLGPSAKEVTFASDLPHSPRLTLHPQDLPSSSFCGPSQPDFREILPNDWSFSFFCEQFYV